MTVERSGERGEAGERTREGERRRRGERERRPSVRPPARPSGGSGVRSPLGRAFIYIYI